MKRDSKLPVFTLALEINYLSLDMKIMYTTKYVLSLISCWRYYSNNKRNSGGIVKKGNKTSVTVDLLSCWQDKVLAK